jgi:RNA polymerase sigma-70 factor (ECF subfamily)
MTPTPATPAPPASNVFADWLRAARDGSPADLGRALDACRGYLLLIAEEELGSTLRPKAGASDLVQESLLDAQKGFDRFRGGTRDEFFAWVGQILRRNLADLARRFREADCRAVGREQPLTATACPDTPPNGLDDSPSAAVTRAEDETRLRSAIARLPDEARLVLAWRQHDRLDWAAIGGRLGKSADAARKAWFRAVERLRAEMGHHHDPG